MGPDESMRMLTPADVAEAQPVQAAAVAEFLEPTKLRANVRGIGLGVKWSDGEPTGKPALLVLVTHKVPKESLTRADLVPATLQGMPTDVLAIGRAGCWRGCPTGSRSSNPCQASPPGRGRV